MIVTVENESAEAQAEQCRRLAYVLGLTQDMLQVAEAGDWDKVARLEQERREDLVNCFAQARPTGDTELVAQAIATLLHLNEELMAKLKVARSSVMEQGAEFTRNRSAASSYMAVDSAL